MFIMEETTLYNVASFVIAWFLILNVLIQKVKSLANHQYIFSMLYISVVKSGAALHLLIRRAM